MKKNIYIISLLSIFLFSILFSGCDEISNYKQNNTVKPPDKAIRKILIEEYTGFKCGNCPSAAELAHSLIEKYPGRIVLMELHAGGFAKPSTAHPYDFRTYIGNALDTLFGVSSIGNPNGIINRNYFDGEIVQNPPKWEADVLSFLDSVPNMTLNIMAFYNQTTKDIDINVDINYISKGDSTNFLSVYVTEDSIIQYQTDYRLDPPDIPNYVHNNVLRDAVNGIWGDQLSTTSIPAGTIIKRQFHYKIPEGKVWKAENIKFVAFVHNFKTVNGKQLYEVLQVEETPNLILVI